MKTFFFVTLILLGIVCGCSSGGHGLSNAPYRIARDPTWYPINFEGKVKYVFAFSDELVGAIAQKENLKIEMVTTGSETLMRGLETGQWDAILSDLPPTGKNTDFYSFSEPYCLIGPVLVVPVSTNVNSLQAMGGKIVGVQTGSSSVLFAASVGSIVIKGYENMAQALEDLVRGNIDGVLLGNIPAYSYCKDLYQGILKVATPPMGTEGLRLVTKKGENAALIEKFNTGLKAFQQDGTYNQLAQKWSLPGE